MRELWQITAPHFCAGLVVDLQSNVIVEVAPILGWALHRSWQATRSYFERRGWRVVRCAYATQ